MKPFIYVLIFVFSSISAFAQPANYQFGKEIEIQSSQVSGASPLLDFTLLVNLIDPDLRLVANGGKVENANGHDIVFTLDDCITTLSHQIEKYDPLTGEYIAWVKIPSLSPTIDMKIGMYYGNNTVASDPSTSSAWGSNAAAIYHLSNNDFSDATSNGMNATNFSTTNVPGQIGDARNFNGTGDFLNVSETGTTSLDLLELTMSAWIFPTDYDVISDRGIIINKESTYEMGLQDHTGAFQAASNPGCWRWAGTGIIPLSTWTKVTIVFAGGIQKHYINGVLVQSFGNCSNPLAINDLDLRIGGRGGDGNPASYFVGNIDEVKITNREETADWIATEYANQSSPSTFYTVSGERSASVTCLLLPIKLQNFDCKKVTDQMVQIDWETVSETNSDYFIVERSPNGLDWEGFEKIDGLGNSTTLQTYQTFDYHAYSPISYYRLKQVDADGQYLFSEIKAVSIHKTSNAFLSVYPNPTSDQITLKTEIQEELSSLKLFNSLGKEVTTVIKVLDKNQTNMILDLSNLSSGVYYIQTKTRRTIIQKT